MDQHREVLFGGAAGPGKSVGLLMAALQYVQTPGYHAVILRRTFPMLTQPDGPVMLAHEWLGGTDANWHEGKHRWTFPSGSTLNFGHCQYDRDKYNYQGGGYRFVGFDELTQFTEAMYKYIGFSRRRRPITQQHIPTRLRSTSNPGGIGHAWVKARLIDPETRANRAAFVPAFLQDNLGIDREEYIESLNELDPYEREQLLHGDWDAAPPGCMFERGWFKIVDAAPADAKRLRYWDEAATAPGPGKDPDYTAGVRLAWSEGILYIEDMQRFRADPLDRDKRMRQTAEVDGYAVPIWAEQEPGASGKSRIDHLHRIVLPDFAVGAHRPTGRKEVRAGPVASQAEAGNVRLVRGHWNAAFLDEAEMFPYGKKDQIDAVSGGYAKIMEQRDYAYAL